MSGTVFSLSEFFDFFLPLYEAIKPEHYSNQHPRLSKKKNKFDFHGVELILVNNKEA